MQRATKAEVNAVVRHALALHTLADPGLDQKITRPLLDEAGADAVLDVIAAAVFENDGFDAREMQEVREHQSGGPCPDDADLRAHRRRPSSVGTRSHRPAVTRDACFVAPIIIAKFGFEIAFFAQHHAVVKQEPRRNEQNEHPFGSERNTDPREHQG